MGERHTSGFESRTPTRGKAPQGPAKPGMARRGRARRGTVGLGKELGDWQASRFEPSTPTAQGQARRGRTGLGKAPLGWVGQDTAWHGAAWLGKDTNAGCPRTRTPRYPSHT